MDYSQLNTTCYWCFLYGHQSHHITSFGQLNNNQLTGPIPRELVGISSLKVIDVSKNNLCGTIPTSGPFEHIPLNKLMSMASESSPISVADNEHEDCYVKDGKAKSKVWMHMVKLPTEDKDILKAQCKYCKEIFSAASKNDSFEDYELFLSKKQKHDHGKSQLDLYLEEQNLGLHIDLDILAYWRDASGRFPELASMARDILAISISTVPSESAFSMGKKLINPWRNSLSPKTIQAITCYEDWLRAKGFSLGQSGVLGANMEESSEDEDDEEEMEEGLHGFES
ncbi:uncharacterized protein LOC103718630 isoform X1 [Phoenix dactylifera]|uniref:Uncharacterized protein LOC103718630 isoform X1 n=1 Tax=Phoenix dactylifera TaxID=42345 RepID=A0A8B8ZG46_PHODC|nr:uncharacterized protein LOC103718630 isoform X1 [Phoenix dactylifera]